MLITYFNFSILQIFIYKSIAVPPIHVHNALPSVILVLVQQCAQLANTVILYLKVQVKINVSNALFPIVKIVIVQQKKLVLNAVQDTEYGQAQTQI